MKRARFSMLCLALVCGCGGGSGGDDSDAGHAPPAKVCTFGADQTCNDNPATSSLHGVCRRDGTCVCQLGFAKAESGRCR